jgi:hypothetical protein
VAAATTATAPPISAYFQTGVKLAGLTSNFPSLATGNMPSLVEMSVPGFKSGEKSASANGGSN